MQPDNEPPDDFKSNGYTSESLKMLDTDEGQLNAIFACFGSAAQHAQMFEQALVRFLVTYNKISPETLSIEDFEAAERGLHKKTMGALIKELRKHVNFPDETVPGYFEAALKQRNFLMHHFFLDRCMDLGNTEGRMRLLGELLSIQDEVDRGRVLTNAMRIAVCETLGIKDEYAITASLADK